VIASGWPFIVKVALDANWLPWIVMGSGAFAPKSISTLGGVTDAMTGAGGTIGRRIGGVVDPPGPGFITASCPAPEGWVSLAVKATRKLVPERNVVTRGEPFQVPVELASNPVPDRVIVAVEPSGTVSGEIEVT
jgi:hypothetical protein